MSLTSWVHTHSNVFTAIVTIAFLIGAIVAFSAAVAAHEDVTGVDSVGENVSEEYNLTEIGEGYASVHATEETGNVGEWTNETDDGVEAVEEEYNLTAIGNAYAAVHATNKTGTIGNWTSQNTTPIELPTTKVVGFSVDSRSGLR